MTAWMEINQLNFTYAPEKSQCAVRGLERRQLNSCSASISRFYYAPKMSRAAFIVPPNKALPAMVPFAKLKQGNAADGEIVHR